MEGNIRGAMRWITDRDPGGAVSPYEVDDKTGSQVIETLRKKHPDPIIPQIKQLPKFPKMPPLGIITITETTVAKACNKVRGGAGLGGTNALSLQQWCL